MQRAPANTLKRVPIIDLKFLNELAARGGGTSNRRHSGRDPASLPEPFLQCNGNTLQRTDKPGVTRIVPRMPAVAGKQRPEQVFFVSGRTLDPPRRGGASWSKV